MDDDDREIDPRIADRRDEVQREHRHRLLRRLGVLAGLLLVLALVVAATRSPLLDVDRVEVHGIDQEGRPDAHAVVEALYGVPMLDIDAGRVRDDLAALPWVADAQVRREWPATVVIDLSEREEVAVVAAGDGRWQVLDGTGLVVREVTDPDGRWLELVGVEPAAGPGERVEGVEELLVVARAAPPAVLERVRGVKVGRSGDLLLEIDPVGLVRLGDTTQLDQKMLAAATLFAQVDDRCVAMIDVRVPSVPTIERIPECANPAPPTTVAPVIDPSVIATTPTVAPTPATTLPITTDPPATVLPATVLPTTVLPTTVLPTTVVTG